MQVNPEKAAKHAAAAARKAIEAAQHAHKAAIYAGLLQKGAHEDDHWRTAGKCSSLSPHPNLSQACCLTVGVMGCACQYSSCQ